MTREVTRADFWAHMNPRDVIATPGPCFSIWRTRAGQTVGHTSPGWLLRGRRAYFLGADCPAELSRLLALPRAQIDALPYCGGSAQ